MGSLSEVDLGGHAHAFDKYLAQRNTPVRVELPSRKHVMPKPEKLSKFRKMLIPQPQIADKHIASGGRATQDLQDT